MSAAPISFCGSINCLRKRGLSERRMHDLSHDNFIDLAGLFQAMPALRQAAGSKKRACEADLQEVRTRHGRDGTEQKNILTGNRTPYVT